MSRRLICGTTGYSSRRLASAAAGPHAKRFRGEDDEESGAELGRAGRSAQPRDHAHVDGAALGGALAAPE